uniref:Galectin n=1 Tax=Ditylenchus dipsaci TaxID=166011 RepID=A0A915EII8_9BILA
MAKVWFVGAFVLLLTGLVIAAPAESSSEEGKEKSKEKGYRQYVGEQEYHLPFKTRISEPFKEGQTIHAVGNVSKDPKRIDFNFHKGGNDDDDMPLHLSIRFDEGIFTGKIVYNTFQNGNWSTDEQRISSPYKAQDEFDLRVRIKGGKYQVFGNRREIGVFEQRQPLDGVNHVSIFGSLDSLRVFHYGGTIFANPYNAIAKLTPGKRLDISALPTGNRVNVNLYREGVNMHYKCLFATTKVPFKNEVFDLTIINEAFSFQLFVNGKRFATFAHRGSPNDIETLEIDGNVDVQTVTINDATKA